jgi:hypothetical protein
LGHMRFVEFILKYIKLSVLLLRHIFVIVV